MNLGNKIAQLRKQNNLTQLELADKLSISYQAVSQWENSITYPDITLLPTIASIFNVSLDELFDIEVKQNKTIEFSDGFDKNTLYCVVSKGNKVISEKELKQALSNKKITFEYKGEALNVYSHMDVVCDAVMGNITSLGSVTCDDVTGNIQCSGSITCDNVEGDVKSSGSVTCDNVGGNVSAGGSVNCDNVGGNVSAGGSINIYNE